MDNLNDIRLEAYRLSERRLEDQTSSALAADQRAMSVAGLTLAAAAFLCGLSPNAATPAFLLFGGVVLVFAAGFAWYSARPIDFFMPGTLYRSFDKDIEAQRPPMEIIEEMARNNDASSDKNAKALADNSSLMNFAFGIAILGLLIAIVPQIVATFGTW